MKASDIRTAMLKKWAAPEWALMWEVSNGTGARGGTRYADAIMMSLWPSRGLELHGVEIKVTRSDWRQEAKDPTKAELIAKYCDRWWIHTPPGIVPLEELPPAWGLREWSGKQWKTIKEATLTDAVPMDRTFLAAMLRRADETLKNQARDMMEAERNSLHASNQERIERIIKERTRTADGLIAKVKAFEEASGISLSHTWWGTDEAGRVGRLVHKVREAGLPNASMNLDGTLRQLAHLTKALEAATVDLKEWEGRNDETENRQDG